MIINDLFNNKKPSVAEGEVVPFKRAAVSWQKLPKDVLSLANDWFWANFEGGGLQATMDPKGLGSGIANQQKYLSAQLQQRGWAIDIDDEYENIVLKNQQGQTILLPIEDAQDFTGWAQDTNPVSEQGMAEGKKKPDTYHIVNKDGKPASLASYADKESAVKDRDTKHQSAEVRQLGPRGKVKGVAEVSLGDYRKKAALSKATSQMDRFFGRDDPEKVAQANQTIAKRERGLARADARVKPYTPPAHDAEKRQRELTAKYPNIDELVADAEKNRDPYYDRAEGEAYYRGREAEQLYQRLRQIQRVIQGLNESQADTKKKELSTGTGRINPDTGRPWTPSELKAKYANVDFDQDVRKAELKRLSDLAKQEKLKDKIKASLDDPRDSTRDLAKSFINKGGLGMDFKPPAPTPVPPTPSPAPVTVQGQPPGFSYSNLSQQPGMAQYMQPKPPAAPKPAPSFAQGPTGYKTTTTNVPSVADTTVTPPVARNDSDILQGLIQLQFSPKEAKAAIKQLPPNISTKDAIFRILQLQGKQMSESLTWSSNFNPGRSLYRRMKKAF